MRALTTKAIEALFARELLLASSLVSIGRGHRLKHHAAWAAPGSGKRSGAQRWQTQGFAGPAVLPAVLRGGARQRFSLTSGISDDELVRLESTLNSWHKQESWRAPVARA